MEPNEQCGVEEDTSGLKAALMHPNLPGRGGCFPLKVPHCFLDRQLQQRQGTASQARGGFITPALQRFWDLPCGNSNVNLQ